MYGLRKWGWLPGGEDAGPGRAGLRRSASLRSARPHGPAPGPGDPGCSEVGRGARAILATGGPGVTCLGAGGDTNQNGYLCIATKLHRAIYRHRPTQAPEASERLNISS